MIEVRNLTKFFGSTKVVDNLSFTVEKGEILGFLGPNGAGKSTTMRMITGFIPPSSGTAVVGGWDIANAALKARQKIGYLPENAPVYPDMTVYDYLDFCAHMRGFSGNQRKKRVAETLERCFLSEVPFQTVSTLSKGFKQRVCFAQSILHDPEYLILDEPTDGLDPNQKHEVRQMIRRMSPEKAIILSTHILDEVEAVCSRAMIISEGHIVLDDTPQGVKRLSSLHGSVRLTLSDCDVDAVVSLINGLEGVKATDILETTDRNLVLRAYPATADAFIADRILRRLYEDKYHIDSISVEQGRLDDVFRTVTTPPSQTPS